MQQFSETTKVVSTLNDKREYRIITLKNELEVLLISDPNTTTSAASLCVNTGSFNDPKSVPGLAHFCEHMLFLGTKKYPEPNCYSKYISANSGFLNAYTSGEHTNFYFQVTNNQFLNVLKMFCEFFKTPLFSKICKQKEVYAVNSEHEGNMKKESKILHQCLRLLSNENHPFHQFATGNTKTLHEIPNKEGISVGKLLSAYYNDNFSSNVMKLVVMSNYSLNNLTRFVVESFGDIENKNLIPKVLKINEPIFKPEHKRKIMITNIPNKDETNSKRAQVRILKNSTATIRLIFPINLLSTKNIYRLLISEFNGIYCHLIGHEGEGSLYHLLRNKLGYITHISTYVSSLSHSSKAVILEMKVTREGCRNISAVLTAVSEYNKMIVNADWETEILPILKELEEIDWIRFCYMDKDDLPMNEASELSSNLMDNNDSSNDKQWILKGAGVYNWSNLNFQQTNYKELNKDKHHIPDFVSINDGYNYSNKLDFEPDDYTFNSTSELESETHLFESNLFRKYMNKISPNNMNIVILVSEEWNNLFRTICPSISYINSNIDKFYNFTYKIGDLDSTFLHHLRIVQKNPNLYFPKSNQFIPREILKQNNNKNENKNKTKTKTKAKPEINMNNDISTAPLIIRKRLITPQITLNLKRLSNSNHSDNPHKGSVYNDEESEQLNISTSSHTFINDTNEKSQIQDVTPDIKKPLMIDPALLINSSRLQLWYKEENSFDTLLRSYITLEILSSASFTNDLEKQGKEKITVTHFIVCELFCEMINYLLNSKIYDSSLLGYSYLIKPSIKGDGTIEFSLGGFNEKITLLFEIIFDEMMQFKKSSLIDNENENESQLQLLNKVFAHVLTEKIAYYNSFKTQNPVALASGALFYLLEENMWDVDDRLEALRSVSLKDIIGFGSSNFEFNYVNMFINGDITQNDCFIYEEILTRKLLSDNMSGGDQKWRCPSTIKLQPSSYYEYIIHPIDKNEINKCIVSFFQTGIRADNKTRILTKITSYILNIYVSEKLRTEKQLGYLVFGGSRFLREIVGIHVTLLSDKDPSFLDKEIDGFFEFLNDKIKELTSEEFQELLAKSLIDEQTKSNNTQQEHQRLWDQISSRSLRFKSSFDEDEIDTHMARSITKESFLEFFNKCFISPETKSKLVIGVTQPTDSSNKSKIASEKMKMQIEMFLRMKGLLISSEKLQEIFDSIPNPAQAPQKVFFKLVKYFTAQGESLKFITLMLKEVFNQTKQANKARKQAIAANKPTLNIPIKAPPKKEKELFKRSIVNVKTFQKSNELVTQSGTTHKIVQELVSCKIWLPSI